MSKRVEAVYENGILRPLEPLGLHQHQRVSVIVCEKPGVPSEEEWLDTD
jgi:predicted DNA-binding antitoxin AbrB/MazE fold protein